MIVDCRLRPLLRWLAGSLALLAALAAGPAIAGSPGSCTGRFINPITDVCWSCMFPLSVGGLKIWPSSRPDTDNPSFPICACGSPIPRLGTV